MRTMLACCLFVVVSLLTGCWTTQSGQKSGIIVKVAKEGRYWGTYEGELIRGGLDNASGATGREFHFTLGQFKSDLVNQAIYAMENNKHVVLKYHCEAYVLPWSGETKCFVDEIKILDSAKGTKAPE
ncbi:secreted protein [Legionella beliardensis]|uniref:Secreted protein n=2 Tax=Legionella beliardensis TaxID=91822 RepID=A0A378HYI9_9GAMM|nr:secreted protein [Legionella beliardensis]